MEPFGNPSARRLTRKHNHDPPVQPPCLSGENDKRDDAENNVVVVHVTVQNYTLRLFCSNIFVIWQQNNSTNAYFVVGTHVALALTNLRLKYIIHLPNERNKMYKKTKVTVFSSEFCGKLEHVLSAKCTDDSAVPQKEIVKELMRDVSFRSANQKLITLMVGLAIKVGDIPGYKSIRGRYGGIHKTNTRRTISPTPIFTFGS